jgi:hypothetical protein
MQQYQKQGVIPNNQQALGSKDFEHIGMNSDLHKIKRGSSAVLRDARTLIGSSKRNEAENMPA